MVNQEYGAERYYRHALKDTQWARRQQHVIFCVQSKSHHAEASEKSGQVQLASSGYCHFKTA
jgi:hypothetical protein